jgi:mono/diheme cytochrome c family protein
MKSKLFKFALISLTVGILSACGGQPTETPASAPTDAPASATRARVAPTVSAPSQATEAPTTASSSQTLTVSFANDILPLLQSRCINCHGGERTQEGLSMKTYTDLMAGSKNGPVITAGDANNSLLADLVATQKMPKRGPKLTPPQVQLIVDWINQGALDN